MKKNKWKNKNFFYFISFSIEKDKKVVLCKNRDACGHPYYNILYSLINSIFSIIPNPSANLCNVEIEGFARFFSILIISDWY